jgi:isopentenyl phosphate kinase
VFFGDMLPAADGGHVVVSSDVMIERLVDLGGARTALFLTDVAGVLGGDPEALLPSVSQETVAAISRRASDERDVSAGMRGKLASAFRVAARVDRCYIASGLDESVALRLLLGAEAPATRVRSAP